MEPNQNINNMPNATGAPVAPNVPRVPNTSGATNASVMTPKPNSDVVFKDKPKKNIAVILGMVLLGILAVGGIAFGVWAMMDGNAQKAELNAQIDSLKQKNNALNEQVNNLQAQIDSYSSVTYEILPPKWGEAEAVVVDGVFTIKNANGEVFTQFDEYVVDEIVSCDSGTETEKAPMTCVVKTPEGEAKIVYNYDEQSLEYMAEPVE